MAQKYLENVEEIITEGVGTFHISNSVTPIYRLQKDTDYPLAPNTWLKVPDVICVFVDIRNSTGLSATHHEKGTGSIYELFTGTAVRIFNSFNASYIDVKGDGVFAIFDKSQIHHAIAGAITFKTFARETFMPLVKEKLNGKVDIGFHMGIDQKTVIVKQIGMKDKGEYSSRKNEVWAGKPINMAAKLAALSKDGELLVSDRFYEALGVNDLIKKTCGCVWEGDPKLRRNGPKTDHWTEMPVPVDSKFDFDKIWCLKTTWCNVHGKEWCEKIIQLDA